MSPAGRPSAAAIAARRGWGKDGKMTEEEWHRQQWLSTLETESSDTLSSLRDLMIRDHADRVSELEANLGRIRAGHAKHLGEIDAAIRRKERKEWDAKLQGR